MAEESRDNLLERLESLEKRTDEIRAELSKLRAEVQGSSVVVEPAQIDSTPQAPARVVPVPDSPVEKRSFDLEFWLGGRGLLLIGVVALVLAVGFFVKYSIEQGWLGPAVRVALGAAVGVVAVTTGERIRARGYRTYGLWVAAGGFSAVYLSVWAASILYALIPPGPALILMVLVVGAAAALGHSRGSQSFVALAAFGGYLAPLLLEVGSTSVVMSLGYLSLLSGAALWLGWREGWPGLTALAIVGGTLMTLPAPAASAAAGVYLVALIVAAQYVARRHRWVEVSAMAVILGWLTLWAGREGWGIDGMSFAVLAAGLWMADLLGYIGVRAWSPVGATSRWGSATSDSAEPPRRRQVDLGELGGLVITYVPAWAFYASAMTGLNETRWVDSADLIGLLLGIALGSVYLLEARAGPEGRGTAGLPWRLALVLALWLVAPTLAWSGLRLVGAWLVEGALFIGAGLLGGGVTIRAGGLGAITLATLAYYNVLGRRPESNAAFIDAFGLMGLAVVLAPAAWALALERVRRAAAWESALRPLLYLASAALFLGWGTGEIVRFYDLLPEASAWTLASDLSISGFWLAYAAALLAVGFRLDRPPIRWTGLAMALVSAGKVFLYDLSNLAELYRIVSFVLLSAVLLALSFRYQRLRRVEEG